MDNFDNFRKEDLIGESIAILDQDDTQEYLLQTLDALKYTESHDHTDITNLGFDEQVEKDVIENKILYKSLQAFKEKEHVENLNLFEKLRNESYFLDYNEFQGVVTSVNYEEEKFEADIFDTRYKEKSYHAIFDFDEIPYIQTDIKLLKEGSYIIWVFGRERKTRSEQKISYVKIRRPVSWSNNQLIKAEENAKRRAEYFQQLRTKSSTKE